MLFSIFITSAALALSVSAGNPVRTDPAASKFFDSKFIGACEHVLCPSHRPSKKAKGKEAPVCAIQNTNYQMIGYSTLNKHRHNPKTAPGFLENMALIAAGTHTDGRRNEMVHFTKSIFLDTDATTRGSQDGFLDEVSGTLWQGCALMFNELSRNLRPLGEDPATAMGSCSMSFNE